MAFTLSRSPPIVDVMGSAGSPRVLMLDHTAQEGGAELALLRLVDALPPGAFDLCAILFADGPLRAHLRSRGIRTLVVALDPALATASRDRAVRAAAASAAAAASFVPRLVRAIRGAHPDLVVANSLKSALFAAVAAPLAGVPWVWHLHDRLAADYLPAALAALMRAVAAVAPRAIVVNSRATLATLPARARRRAIVAYPGLPPDAFADGPEGRDDAVGIIGRVSPTKGQREFVQAAARVAEAHPEMRFRVIGAALFGEEGYERSLRDQVAALGLDDRVEFTGWVSDAADRLRRLRLLVHASPTPEPFGQVVTEAMAAGVPVVATAAGGIPEILDPTGPALAEPWRATATGVLVRPGDAGALAGAITAVLDDPDAAAARAAAARADADARFRAERTAAAVRAAWERSIR